MVAGSGAEKPLPRELPRGSSGISGIDLCFPLLMGRSGGFGETSGLPGEP